MKKIILALTLVALAAAGCNKAQDTDNNNTPDIQTFLYQDSYVTGYEGDFSNIKYSFEYPITKFVASSDASNKSRVILTEKSNNHAHTISIFYNGAAGMANSAEYFKEVVKCGDCTPSTKTFTLKDASDVKVYENASGYYVVYAHAPGFVALHLLSPTDEIEKVVSTLDIQVSKASGNTQP